MGNFIYAMIKNDFTDRNDDSNSSLYAKATIERIYRHFNPDCESIEWKMTYYPDSSYRGDLEDKDGRLFYFSIWDELIEIGIFDDFCAYLENGYWVVDTVFDDYLFASIYDGRFYFRDQCFYIAKAFGVKEMWLCEESHVYDYPHYTQDFSEWLKYAEKVGIVDVNMNLLMMLHKLSDHAGFEYNYGRFKRLDGEIREDSSWSYPIYHDCFEDME